MSYTYSERACRDESNGMPNGSGRYRNIFWDPVNYKFILRFSVIPVTFLDIFVAKVGICR